MRPPSLRPLLRSLPSAGNKLSTSAPVSNKSSTSALDYKLHHPRARPPSLPEVIDPPRWSAEEAVTNILYNTPPPSREPYTRHVLNALVQNEPGVLSRVSGILAARGFNIDSLVVCATEVKDLSRMCIVLRGQEGVVEQARRQLEDLVPVWAVLDYTRTKMIERELLLAKISILGPEYFEEQLATRIASARSSKATPSLPSSEHSSHAQGGKLPTSEHTTNNKIEPDSPANEVVERQQEALEDSHPALHHHQPSHRSPSTPPRSTLTPSEALRQKHSHLSALSEIASLFQARIVDVSHDSIVIEMTGKTSRVDAFLKLVRPYGILEAARTGAMVMPRARIVSEWMGAEDVEGGEVPPEEGGDVDASLLPPG
ncbi:acetolactate synthase [Atractiella rhizophila]|nr:acetolactate synthase [Atractiella rhizophila]